MINREIAGWVLALFWAILAVWLLVQPLKTWAADDTIRGDQVATKEHGSTHGWVYNNKTQTLQFCMQVSGQQYDAMAEVLCIAYPKKVKPISEYDSFFLDGGSKNFDPESELRGIPKYLPAEK